jgi:hypothetical protein
MHKESDFFKDIKPLTKYTQPAMVEHISLPHTTYKRKKQHHFTGLWLFVVVAVLVLFWAVSSRMSVATISITSTIDSISLNENFILDKTSTDRSPILFETVSLDTEIPGVLVLSEEVIKQEKAKGDIIIYNSYTNAPQKIVKNTRLINSKGSVYLTDATVTVPGFATINNQKVPGTIPVSVSALLPGETSNSDPDTLRIIAFKGSTKYDTIIAKNNKSISGGLDGTYYTTATTQIDESVVNPVLAERLNELVKKQIPENYLYIPGLSIIKLNQNSQIYVKEKNTELPLTGTIEQIVLEKNSFVDYFESKKVPINRLDNLDFTLLNGNITTREEKEENIRYSVSVTGTVQKENTVNEQALKEKLVGTYRQSFHEIMNSMSDSIASAELSIRPFWIFTIPKSLNRINIIHTNGR